MAAHGTWGAGLLTVAQASIMQCLSNIPDDEAMMGPDYGLSAAFKRIRDSPPTGQASPGRLDVTDERKKKPKAGQTSAHAAVPSIPMHVCPPSVPHTMYRYIYVRILLTSVMAYMARTSHSRSRQSCNMLRSPTTPSSKVRPPASGPLFRFSLSALCKR